MKKLAWLGLVTAMSMTAVTTAQAEVTLLHPDPDGHELWSPLKLAIKGRYRIRARDFMGEADNNNYWHNGNNNGTWAGVSGSYAITRSFRAIAYWRVLADTFHILGFKDHYPENRKKFIKQSLYAGFDSDRYGRLTVGQQKTVYRLTVGGKTDLWQNDWHARAEALGVNAKYDGSYRSSRTVLYELDPKPFKLYAMLFLPTETYHAAGYKFKRGYGGAIGAEYQIQDDLSISGSYTLIEANTYDEHYHDGTRKTENEQILGAALTWKPGHWWFAFSGLYFGDFVAAYNNQYQDDGQTKHLIGSAYGLTGFGSYSFSVKGPLTHIMPYVAITHTRYTSDEDYFDNNYTLGVDFGLPHRTEIMIEHTFANSDLASKDIDSNWVNFQINF